MQQLPQLITDLGLIMGAAAVVTLVFQRLRQPTVLGYIIAGIFVGPHFPLFPSVADAHNVEVWAQIGVIFLLFSLGLEFSFKKLMTVGGSASIATLTEVILMLAIGFGTGKALGWSLMDSLFLGVILCISSTTIILRAYEELGVKGKKFAQLVFGILVVQDLVAIAILVLLPTLALSQALTGADVLFPVAKLAFFLVLWFVSGIFFLPTLLRKVRRFMNDEMLLVTSLALCFGMVMLTTRVGFSPALGAFIMGSILAETRAGGRIEHLIKSVKDLFGAVFFISVGMMIDPVIIPQYWLPILVIAVVTIIGQSFTTTMGALLAGHPLKTSVQAGMSLSQIGEFSFIIASLGLTMKVTSTFLYPVAVAVSALTTFTTPYMIRFSYPVYQWLDRKLPAGWRSAIERYSAGARSAKTVSDWQAYMKSYAAQLALYSMIALGIVLLISGYVLPSLPGYRHTSLIATVVTILILSPFLWALAVRKIKPEITHRLWQNRNSRGPLLMLQALRLLTAMLIIGFVIHRLASYYWAVGITSGVILLFAVNYRRLQRIYDRIEGRFMINFHEKERLEQKRAGLHLTPWDAHITNFTLTPDFTGIGKSLMELRLRENLGVNVAMIRRGAFTINVPDRKERLYPQDILYVIGTDDQIDAFKKYLQQQSITPNTPDREEQEITLQWMEITPGSPLDGRTIKESAIRERTHGLIVGIERDGERILNPESDVPLVGGDLLWIVGNKRRIRALAKQA